MLEYLITLIIYFVVLGLFFWAVWWFIGFVNPPEPFNKIVRVLVGLVALILILYALLGLIGGATPLPPLWRR